MNSDKSFRHSATPFLLIDTNRTNRTFNSIILRKFLTYARLAIIKCLLRNVFDVLRFSESYPKICNYLRTSQEIFMMPKTMDLSEKSSKSKAMPVSAIFIFSLRDRRRCYINIKQGRLIRENSFKDGFG